MRACKMHARLRRLPAASVGWSVTYPQLQPRMQQRKNEAAAQKQQSSVVLQSTHCCAGNRATNTAEAGTQRQA